MPGGIPALWHHRTADFTDCDTAKLSHGTGSFHHSFYLDLSSSNVFFLLVQVCGLFSSWPSTNDRLYTERNAYLAYLFHLSHLSLACVVNTKCDRTMIFGNCSSVTFPHNFWENIFIYNKAMNRTNEINNNKMIRCWNKHSWEWHTMKHEKPHCESTWQGTLVNYLVNRKRSVLFLEFYKYMRYSTPRHLMAGVPRSNTPQVFTSPGLTVIHVLII